MEQFAGKFQLVSHNNLDEYHRAIGVSSPLDHRPVHIKCTVDGDVLTLKVHSFIMHDKKYKLKLDQETELDTPDGRHVKAMLHLDGNKLIQKENWDGKESTSVHEVKGDEWVETMTCAGVTCTRHFKRE